MVELVIAITAMLTATLGAAKQYFDNKKLKDWLCTKNPCKDRIQKPEI